MMQCDDKDSITRVMLVAGASVFAATLAAYAAKVVKRAVAPIVNEFLPKKEQ